MKQSQQWGVPQAGVYLMRALEGNLWKIGVSQHVVGRRSVVSRGQRPCQLAHVVTTNDPFALETYLHKVFSRWRHHEPGHREWFNLYTDQVHRIMALTHVQMLGKRPVDKAIRLLLEP